MSEEKAVRRIPIETATADQLRWHAQNQMGLEVSSTMNKHTLIAKIRQGHWEHDYIHFGTEKAEGVFDRPTAPKEANTGPDGGPAEPMVTVTIPMSERPGGKDAVPLFVNGIGIWVKRATQSKIKYRYFLQLQGAVETRFDQELDARNRPGPMIPMEIALYPHTVNFMPPQDEIDAWLKWDADQSNLKSLEKLEERKKHPQPTVIYA